VIHHVTLEVSDLARSAAFYDAMLGPLGWRRQVERGDSVAWGIIKPVFSIRARPAPCPGFGHVCFSATGIAAVKAAWEGGMAAGGANAGPPGPRPENGAGYYAAHLTDPDGYRVEVAIGGE
jgi:catechol 2,3-dioxygenase-like lactoylglutathione lyase family enzyme